MKVKLLFTIFCLLISAFSYSQEKAQPRNGEGLQSFLVRYKRPGNEYRKKFIELNRSKLGPNQSLLLGVYYELPPLLENNQSSSTSTSTNKQTTSKKRKEPLFGPLLAEYTVKSDGKLKGTCFYVVSGHGGPDPGATGKIGKYDLHEDEYAYDIALRLARALLIEGATVHIIIQDAKDGIRDDMYLNNSDRETCMGETIPLNQKKRLQQRCNKINALSSKQKEKHQRAIFIHLDSRSQKHQLDVFFYHDPNCKKGKRLANTMKKTFKQHYDKHQPGRGFTGTVDPRNLHVLCNSGPVALFAELGNIQNTFDQKRFLLASNRQALANWLCRGMINDYEDSKKQK